MEGACDRVARPVDRDTDRNEDDGEGVHPHLERVENAQGRPLLKPLVTAACTFLDLMPDLVNYRVRLRIGGVGTVAVLGSVNIEPVAGGGEARGAGGTGGRDRGF